MIALVAGCTSNFMRRPGPLVRREGAALAGSRLLGLDAGGDADDEEASMEGWLQKQKEAKVVRWHWQSWWFRLEPGPHLLSFYASHIWQGCRREGAYDLTQLVAVRARLRRDGLNAALCLEFSSSSAAAYSVLEDTELVDLRVPDGWEAARGWEAKLLRCIEEALLQACEQCRVYDGFADSAARILVRAQMAAAEGRPHIDVNQVRQPGTEATALMLAAQAGHERVCTHLLMARADAGLHDADGHTAADLAAAAGYVKVLALVRGTAATEPLPQPTVLGAAQ